MIWLIPFKVIFEAILAFLLISVPIMYKGFSLRCFPRNVLFDTISYKCFKNVPSPHPISIIPFGCLSKDLLKILVTILSIFLK